MFSGSSGEEVLLSERRVHKEDVENLLAAPPADSDSSPLHSAVDASLGHSDDEQEQDFVSSVVSRTQGPRVHWGDLPKRTDKEKKGEQLIESREAEEDESECHLSQDKERKESHKCETEDITDAEEHKQQLTINTDQVLPEQKDLAEEATAKLTATLHTASLPTPPCQDTNPSVENQPHLDLSALTLTSTGDQNNRDTLLQKQTDLNITQVGMSRRGAAGLRDLLRNQSLTPTPDSIRLNLLECLKQTLKEWSTDETLTFLYGADHSLRLPFGDVEEVRKEEELDEDDLEDEVTMEDKDTGYDGMKKQPSAAAPDYKTLQKETQQLELMVKEFYKGTWILPEDTEKPDENKVS